MRLKPQFDSTPAVTLLRRWIAAFSIPAVVEAVSNKHGALTFNVTVTDNDYFEAMLRPISPGWCWNQTLAGALGTLFRAIGSFNGHKIQVEVVLL